MQLCIWSIFVNKNSGSRDWRVLEKDTNLQKIPCILTDPIQRVQEAQLSQHSTDSCITDFRQLCCEKLHNYVVTVCLQETGGRWARSTKGWAVLSHPSSPSTSQTSDARTRSTEVLFHASSLLFLWFSSACKFFAAASTSLLWEKKNRFYNNTTLTRWHTPNSYEFNLTYKNSEIMLETRIHSLGPALVLEHLPSVQSQHSCVGRKRHLTTKHRCLNTYSCIGNLFYSHTSFTTGFSIRIVSLQIDHWAV